MRLPTITELAGELRLINDNVQGETEVFLAVWDENWALRLDWAGREGMVGVTTVPGYPHRFNAREKARHLLSQAQYARENPEMQMTLAQRLTRHKKLKEQRRPSHAEARRAVREPQGRPYFTMPGTDDYGPGQAAYPQFITSNYLNGLGELGLTAQEHAHHVIETEAETRVPMARVGQLIDRDQCAEAFDALQSMTSYAGASLAHHHSYSPNWSADWGVDDKTPSPVTAAVRSQRDRLHSITDKFKRKCLRRRR